MTLPKSIQNLVDSLESLPGIGPKTAQRLTFYLLRMPQMELERFSQNLIDLKLKTVICQTCFNIDEINPCRICGDSSRNRNIICVVATPLDVIALEKSNFKGVYHVLGGLIDPLNRVGPEDLKIDELKSRLTSQSSIELILATNPTMEGEATAMYIQRILKGLPVKMTRIGRGLPIGSDIEYADEGTLARALEGRREVEE
ncbi:MAG: recombination mediator RecR [candidate division WWE3 bacterium]|nr:recombination mediator RecR [candidate division WWE3 bacterium]